MYHYMGNRRKIHRIQKEKRLQRSHGFMKVLAMGTVVSMLVTSCQKSPDSSIVVNKDMDNLIEEAQNSESGTVNIEEAAANYDTYQTQLSDETLNVTVNVDAKVDIPQTNQLSVIRVEQTPITQELIDNVRNELMGEETIYDGAVSQIQTKSNIEKAIQQLQNDMNSLEIGGDSGTPDEAGLEVYKNEYQMRIDSYQEQYENAPSTIDWASYTSDGQLRTVEELYNRNTTDSFYSWEYSLNPEGDVLYAITEGDDLQRKELYVQNNENYGNCIRYIKGSVGINSSYVVYISSMNLEEVSHANDALDIWLPEESVPESFVANYEIEDLSEVQDVSSAATTITKEQAVDTANQFLTTVGIDGFECYSGDKYCEACWYVDSDGSAKLGYQTYYILQYMRNIDGAFVTFDSTAKHEEGWSGDSYVKKDWPVECIEFRINDDGIVGFTYNAPLQMTETVVEQSAIQSFDDVRETFEQMVLVTNAHEDDGSTKTIDIDRVVLGYARISEADSYDTGLMVPVWDFMGSYAYLDDAWSPSNYGSILTINAIDGSIIDRSVGY